MNIPSNAVSLASAGLIAATLAMPASAANVGTDIADAFKNGQFNVDFRYRYEFVDQDSFADDANASTLRTRLVFKSAEYKDFFVTINMDDVRTIGNGNYNSTRNGKTGYPVVADPKGTDLNLASVTYTGLDGGTIVAGRQRIIRGNSRFIGNVGWRQNEQTYDAATIDYAVTDKLQVFYGYVGEVKRIFGPDEGTPAASWNSDSHLINASYVFSPLFNLSAYAYLLDFDEAPASSSETYGIRLDGKGDFSDDLSFTYALEYADQGDYKDNPADYSESYYLLEAGLGMGIFGATAGYEVLSGDGTDSFQTPLATLHKFNGLADQFLTTPVGGLEDMYLKATAKALGGSFMVVYHDFSQETGSADYGSEIDFIAKWKFLENYSVLAGFGLFDVDNNAPATGPQNDVDKIWLQLGASF
ncbi:MAG: alginate export family protein [Gammaproteobacteria bacterium]|nr:alginate export family protein [Gammaproteobacteria bacterium]MCP4088332.1 alginate export family protein [Gammaproteobacteria bacterium]MCP4276357.1 alginate export family protein [Gammaproteobacteria bacterium]MCP4831004.1 alginate export family protein [Gammaproteobacteria bacterium]MCP4927475.1 alginate export family protein [Gammaproteobacteria bacterium]